MALPEWEPPDNETIWEDFKRRSASPGRFYLEYDGQLVELCGDRSGLTTYVQLSYAFGNSRRLQRDSIKVNGVRLEQRDAGVPGGKYVVMLSPADIEQGRFHTPADPIKITGVPVDTEKSGPAHSSASLGVCASVAFHRCLQGACKNDIVRKIVTSIWPDAPTKVE